MTNVEAITIQRECAMLDWIVVISRRSSQRCGKGIHERERKDLLEQGREKQTRIATLTGNNAILRGLSSIRFANSRHNQNTAGRKEKELRRATASRRSK